VGIGDSELQRFVFGTGSILSRLAANLSCDVNIRAGVVL